jgi:hypothetical protein
MCKVQLPLMVILLPHVFEKEASKSDIQTYGAQDTAFDDQIRFNSLVKCRNDSDIVVNAS